VQRYIPRFATVGLLAGATTTNAIFNSVGGEALGVSADAVSVSVGRLPTGSFHLTAGWSPRKY